MFHILALYFPIGNFKQNFFMKKKVIFVGALLVVSSSIFAQQEKESQIEEVSIASKKSEPVYKAGKNVQLITKKDLEKYQGQNLNEVLQQVSGVQITGNYNNNAEPKSTKIRGGKQANLLILLDGVPLKDVTGNDYTVSDLRFLALENVESIEILNGASSVLYGSNATVSVINIITNNKSSKEIEGNLSVRGGSYDTFAQSAAIKGKLENFNYQISGSNEKSEGLSAALGENFDKDGFEKQNVAARFGYADGNFDASINGGYMHHFFNFDNGAFADGTYRGNDSQYFGGLNANFKYNKGKLTFNSRYTANDRKVDDFNGVGYQDQYTYTGQNLFLELYNGYEVSENIYFTLGAQHENQNLGATSLPFGGTNLEDTLLKEDTKATNTDVFANAQFSYKEFHADAGARYTNHSKFGDHFVYSINPYFLKEKNEYFFKIGYSYSTAFIAPTLYQNYGTLPYTLPNFDLKPETNQSHEIDFSIGSKDRSKLLQISAFQRMEKDVFAYITNPDFTGNFVNVDENKVKGIEISANYAINKYVKLGGNFSYVEKDDDATMLRLPKQRVNSFVELMPFESTRLTLSQQFVSKRTDAYFDYSDFTVKNVELDQFNVFNLNINQKIINSLEVFANVGNLFNTSYTDVAGYTTKARNYTLGFDYKF